MSTGSPVARRGPRVLHLLKTSDWALWALRQIEQLVQLGAEVHVALPPGGRLVGRYREVGAVVHPTALAGWGAVGELRALVRKVRPDIVHSHFVKTTLLLRAALGRGGPPRVFQVPGPFHLEHPLTRLVEVLSANRSDAWIGSCRWTSERYRRSGIGSQRVFLSYYGTDVEHCRPRPGGALRAELGIDRSVPLVGMLAFVYPPKRYLGYRRGVKGHEDLIEALALCRREEPNLRCVFVGGAWAGAERYEQSIRDLAARRCGDAAIFLGSRSDVPEILADLDVLAIPSRSENVGAAVEGLLAEVPTVATRVGGLPDLVEDPATGWLVPPGDPARMASAILEALEDRDEAHRRALRGAARAREMFDVRRTAREVYDIYRQILSRRERAAA